MQRTPCLKEQQQFAFLCLCRLVAKCAPFDLYDCGIVVAQDELNSKIPEMIPRFQMLQNSSLNIVSKS